MAAGARDRRAALTAVKLQPSSCAAQLRNDENRRKKATRAKTHPAPGPQLDLSPLSADEPQKESCIPEGGVESALKAPGRRAAKTTGARKRRRQAIEPSARGAHRLPGPHRYPAPAPKRKLRTMPESEKARAIWKTTLAFSARLTLSHPVKVETVDIPSPVQLSSLVLSPQRVQDLSTVVPGATVPDENHGVPREARAVTRARARRKKGRSRRHSVCRFSVWVFMPTSQPSENPSSAPRLAPTHISRSKQSQRDSSFHPALQTPRVFRPPRGSRP